MSENQTTRQKFSRRGRVTAAVSCVAAALVALGVSVQPATADGGAHAAHHSAASAAAPAAALAAPGLGSQNLIQSGDFFQQGLAPVAATFGLAGRQALSACSGEETMRVLTKGRAAGYADVRWTFDTRGSLLNESAADGSTVASATSSEKQLNALVSSCRNEPTGHWHYGAPQALTVTGGEGRWYPAYTGDGVLSGGVAVIRSGHRVAIVELAGAPSGDPRSLKGLTAAAIHRLAG
ncbi:hypothetical protein DN069_36775 [Streptacidiphilus pinicola]|uniref:PknH-like extracellular domain-containing protein n=1 Tax=Streptacidiphilus pinicola TaxID=2219663 RepID=A0A2X0IBF1_9ACTN|nr:hypothetical protein [Streptacidiphilus pinicola]RAG80701.1 hypothetical protein DN069_36775 [Streptacidiphilus pinicola]